MNWSWTQPVLKEHIGILLSIPQSQWPFWMAAAPVTASASLYTAVTTIQKDPVTLLVTENYIQATESVSSFAPSPGERSQGKQMLSMFL